MHETECSGLVHWDDLEGWDGKGGGRGVQDGEHMYTMANSCQCMAETTTPFCKKEKKIIGILKGKQHSWMRQRDNRQGCCNDQTGNLKQLSIGR